MSCNETCINGLIPRFDPNAQRDGLGCYNLKPGISDTFNGLATLNQLQNKITFSNPWTDQNLMDPGYCLKHCADFTFTYAAVARKTDCYCGKESALEAYEMVSDTLCNYTCTFLTPSGNVTYACGGDVAYTVYSTKSPNYSQTQITVETKLNIMSNLGNDPRYRGCVRDSQFCPGQRALNKTCYSPSTDMSVDKCLDLCKGSKFAGLESRNQCFCSDDVDFIGRKVAPEDCSGTCEGNITQICGGSWAVSVYEVPTSSSPNNSTTSTASPTSLPSTISTPSNGVVITAPSTLNLFFLLITYILVLKCFKH